MARRQVAQQRIRDARQEAARTLGGRAEPTGPHVRLGILWHAVAGAAVLAGAPSLAVWMAVPAGLAGAQVARAWKAPEGADPLGVPSPKARMWVAGIGAAIVPFGGLAGLLGIAVASLVVLLGSVILELIATRHSPAPMSVVRHVLGTGLVGWAAASPVLVRHGSQGVVATLALLAFAAFYDAGSYLLGTGAVGRWEGPVAGMASVAACTVAVAAIFESVLPGGGAWGLGLLAAVTAPIGPWLATRMLGETEVRPGERAPALRRLDSLLVMGPAVAVVLATTMQR